MNQRVLITGGCGFLGSHVAQFWAIERPNDQIVVIDALTYAGNVGNLTGVPHAFVHGDVANSDDVARAFTDPVDIVLHLAAETHVDRSIVSASTFVRTNVLGTQVLLDAARKNGVSRFVHVSTDEVYGSLAESSAAFAESSAFRPSSPYAASKVGGEALVFAANATHGLNTVIARPANCFGLRQFPEKLLPVLVRAALSGAPLPLYGDGLYRRDWLAAPELAQALFLLAHHGEAGAAYNIPGSGERTNRDVAEAVCRATGTDPAHIVRVADRPGHDRRYAVDGGRIRALGFAAQVGIESALPSLIREANESLR